MQMQFLTTIVCQKIICMLFYYIPHWLDRYDDEMNDTVAVNKDLMADKWFVISPTLIWK